MFSAGQTWTARVPAVVVVVLVAIALLCAFAAVGSVFYSGVQPTREFVDEFVFLAPNNLGYAAFLLVLAAALARRKRVAFWTLVILLCLQLMLSGLTMVILMITPIDTLVGADGRELLLPWWVRWGVAGNIVFTAFVLAILSLSIQQFYGRVQRASLPKALTTLLLLLSVFVVLGYGLVSAFPGSLVGPEDRFSWTFERVVGGAITFDVTRTGQAPGWVNLVLGLFGMAAMFTSLTALFRSQRTASVLPPDDEQRVRTLLAEQGERDSLGYFATRRDKAVLFSASGKAAISYRVVAGVCLASGDPIGDREAWQPAIDRWLAMCREYTWRPAVMGVGEEGAEAYARAGLKILQIGDEAVLDVSAFTLEGREMRPVRQAVNRLHRIGYSVRVRRHREVPADEMANAARLAVSWRDTDAERGFSMALGRLGDPTDGQCVLVEALDPDGQVNALLSLTPWGRHGLSLDLMRRDRNADNGLVELMVTSLVQAAPRWGVERISLNFAVFRSAFEEGARIGAGPILRTWRGILLFFSRWWQLESLFRANVKYQPRWVPRFLGFGDRRELARVGVASAVAEGFLPGGVRRNHAAAMAVTSAEARLPQGSDEPVDHGRMGRVPEQMRVRMDKLARLRDAGTDPYPVAVPRTASCAEVADRHGGLEPDTRTGESTAVAGRVMLLRDHGKLCFATLRDWSGQLQIMLSAQDTGEQALRDWKSQVDIGDHVSVQGEPITTRHGELTVAGREWTLAAKCLHPLPDKHLGLTDQETRARKRYVDLLVGSEARNLLTARSAAVQALRSTLLDGDYLEVETPILQPVHGGATARPFTTRINAYDMRMYLRIAPELYLKRLCIGGVEKVFELGRTFRNEGVSYKHNPEFTMLEAYQAHADYTTMRELCQRLVQAAATAANGAEVARRTGADGGIEELDLSGQWPVITVNEALSTALGEEVTADTTLERLQELCDHAEVAYSPAWGRGAVVLELYERLVEEHTVQPTFYTDFPTEVSPLTRQHRDDPRLAERWDLVAFGTELGTAYSELIDPVEQRRRLTEQSLLAAGGDPEAMELDEDFLEALEYAMPPTGGLGLGVDRLVMLLTGRSIRETLPFPLVRPHH